MEQVHLTWDYYAKFNNGICGVVFEGLAEIPIVPQFGVNMKFDFFGTSSIFGKDTENSRDSWLFPEFCVDYYNITEKRWYGKIVNDCQWRPQSDDEIPGFISNIKYFVDDGWEIVDYWNDVYDIQSALKEK